MTDEDIHALRQIALDDEFPEGPKEDHIAWIAADTLLLWQRIAQDVLDIAGDHVPLWLVYEMRKLLPKESP